MKQGKELARVTEDGISCGTSLNENARIGAVRIKGYDIYNTSDVTDEGCIRINTTARRAAEQNTVTLPCMTEKPAPHLF